MCCYFLIEYRLAPKNSGHENCAISCERNEGEGNSFHWLKTHCIANYLGKVCTFPRLVELLLTCCSLLLQSNVLIAKFTQMSHIEWHFTVAICCNCNLNNCILISCKVKLQPPLYLYFILRLVSRQKWSEKHDSGNARVSSAKSKVVEIHRKDMK